MNGVFFLLLNSFYLLWLPCCRPHPVAPTLAPASFPSTLHLLLLPLLRESKKKKKRRERERQRALMLINSCSNFLRPPAACCLPPPPYQNNHSQTCTGTPDWLTFRPNGFHLQTHALCFLQNTRIPKPRNFPYSCAVSKGQKLVSISTVLHAHLCGQLGYCAPKSQTHTDLAGNVRVLCALPSFPHLWPHAKRSCDVCVCMRVCVKGDSLCIPSNQSLQLHLTWRECVCVCVYLRFKYEGLLST